ncbi:MAG: response regulator [Anaeromyxobacter sp.]
MLRRLTLRGFSVTAVGSAEEALEAAPVGGFGAVLLDAGLPGMNGWEALAALRADERTQALPVVLVTAHAYSADRDRAMALGASGFFSKPVDFAALVALLWELAGARAA